MEVSSSASKDEITRSYRKLVARYHPDRHQGNELEELAEKKMAELNEAYETLSDPKLRAAYDSERLGQSFRPSPTSSSEPTTPGMPRYLKRTLLLLVILGIASFMLRFVRSPRAAAVVGVAIAIAWFGPRLYRLLLGSKTR